MRKPENQFDFWFFYHNEKYYDEDFDSGLNN